MGMREIKFRAWDVSEKEIVPWAHVINDPDDYWHGLMLGQAPEGDVIMQYTGLKDKNGKEIYEGDVIRVFDTNRVCICGEWDDCDSPADGSCEKRGEHKHETVFDCDLLLCTQKVEWNCGYFCTEDTGDYCPPLGDDYLELEVIGNIYENPELLK